MVENESGNTTQALILDSNRFKVVFLGDAFIGKTSLINWFINETFDGSYEVN